MLDEIKDIINAAGSLNNNMAVITKADPNMKLTLKNNGISKKLPKAAQTYSPKKMKTFLSFKRCNIYRFIHAQLFLMY